MSKPSEFRLFFCETCQWHSEARTEFIQVRSHTTCPNCTGSQVVVVRCHSVLELAEFYEKTGPLVGCNYRHYKGGLYRVLRNAVDEKALGHVVIYLGTNQVSWVRPYAEFMGQVHEQGKAAQRFVREP